MGSLSTFAKAELPKSLRTFSVTSANSSRKLGLAEANHIMPEIVTRHHRKCRWKGGILRRLGECLYVKADLVRFYEVRMRIRTKSQRPSLTDISSSLATIANTKLSLRAPGDSLKSSWRSSLGRYWRSTKVLPIWNANWKKSWRGRIVKMVWREAILRRPVEKLNASEWPSTTKPSFCCGLENCWSYIGRYCASLSEHY